MSRKVVVPVALCCAALLMSAPALAMCVDVPKANLRQGPGTQYEKSWEVYQYMPLKKIGEQGNWYQVEDVDGDRHWVFRELLNEKMRCAVVKADKVNVRTGPGTGHAKSPLSPVDKYYSFKVIDTQGDWVKVEDEVFENAWVARRLLWMP